MPSASMKVLLPAPGTPVMPTRARLAGVRQEGVEQPRRQFAVRRQLAFDQRDGAGQRRPGRPQHASMYAVERQSASGASRRSRVS